MTATVTVTSSEVQNMGVRPARLRMLQRSATALAKALLGLLPLAALLGLWQLLGNPASPYFPPPSTWWHAVHNLNTAGTLAPAVSATVQTFLLGLALSILVGAAVGLAIGASQRVHRATGPLLEFCRAMPPPAIVPVALLLIGLGRSMEVSVIVFAGMWPIVLNTAAAVRSLHPLLLESARSLQLSPAARLRKVLLPALLPGLLLGVRVAAPVCVLVTLLVELLTGAPGVGSLLLAAQRNFVTAQAFGLLVVVGILGFLVNAGVGFLERRALAAWPPRTNTR